MKKTCFYRLAMALYKRICIRKLPFFKSRQVETDLIQLHPGESLEWVKTEYYVWKLTLFLMIVLVGTLFAVAAGVNAGTDDLLREDGVLQRGSPGEEEMQVIVRADDGEESYDFQIQLASRQPGEEEAQGLMKELLEELPQYILGENESLTAVSSDLKLWESYGTFPVTVEWESSRPDIVAASGEIRPAMQREDIILKAVLSCGEYSLEGLVELTVLPEVLSTEEKRYRELEDYLRTAEEESRQDESLQLPETWDGKKISWSRKREDKALLLWVGSLAAAVLVYFLSDRDLHEKLEKRKKALEEEYPDLVHELVLLVGAGMTTRGAFQKMAGDYEKKKKSDKRVMPAYEEILRTCREMQSGIAEGAAYERFGRRTGLQQYIRLNGLLMQNLKRGNSSLTERLREEAYKAGEIRLQQGKRLGEEAGTKLLVPMVMMLAVVMLLIMIPAFSEL